MIVNFRSRPFRRCPWVKLGGCAQALFNAAPDPHRPGDDCRCFVLSRLQEFLVEAPRRIYAGPDDATLAMATFPGSKRLEHRTDEFPPGIFRGNAMSGQLPLSNMCHTRILRRTKPDSKFDSC
jgi:hypothetical protein